MQFALFALGEVTRAMTDVRHALDGESRRPPEARGHVPQSFLDVIAKLSRMTPFYGGIVRTSDRQALTGHVTRIALVTNGDLRHAELELVRLIEDDAEEQKFHVDRILFADIDEIRFYQHIATQPVASSADADA